ncbi:MAG: hypothetical protein LUE17_03175, partial [Planctomycetaceae bacterium]|nr:hypothetical protein [Planctomycetaceae bacterium]
PQPSENEVCEKAWELARLDNPELDQGQRNLFFYPATATPPPGEAGRYWRETIRGRWIKLAYAALTAPEGGGKNEDEENGRGDEAEKGEACQSFESCIRRPAPTEYEVGRLAWDLARAFIPSIPSYYRGYFLPKKPLPRWYDIADPWQRLIHGFFCGLARDRIAFPHCHPDGVPKGPPRQTVRPIPSKRHDRYYPVRTPTMDEVRRRAAEMAMRKTPWMPGHVRALFFYPEWVPLPPEAKGLYVQGVIRGYWFVLARDALQREYNAMPRVRMPRRKWKHRRRPNPFRSWTRHPLIGPPPGRRRLFRLPGLCVLPAAPPGQFPTRPGAPPGRPRQEGTPAPIRLPEEDRAPHPFPPGRPGGFNSAKVMLFDRGIVISRR